MKYASNNLSLSPSLILASEDTVLEPFLVFCEQPRAKDSTVLSQHIIYYVSFTEQNVKMLI